jgi:hypothetical protein
MDSFHISIAIVVAIVIFSFLLHYLLFLHMFQKKQNTPMTPGKRSNRNPFAMIIYIQISGTPPLRNLFKPPLEHSWLKFKEWVTSMDHCSTSISQDAITMSSRREDCQRTSHQARKHILQQRRPPSCCGAYLRKWLPISYLTMVSQIASSRIISGRPVIVG